jgi:carbon-monoxide dehydrogenase small subunit
MSDLSQTAAKSDINLFVNGKAVTVRAFAMERLLDVLRIQIGLTGTKEGCGEGEWMEFWSTVA